MVKVVIFFWNREYARKTSYTHRHRSRSVKAYGSIGASWVSSRRTVRRNFATDPYVEIETSVPHRNTRAAIFKILRFIVCHVDISYLLTHEIKKELFNEKNYFAVESLDEVILIDRRLILSTICLYNYNDYLETTIWYFNTFWYYHGSHHDGQTRYFIYGLSNLSPSPNVFARFTYNSLKKLTWLLRLMIEKKHRSKLFDVASRGNSWFVFTLELCRKMKLNEAVYSS